MYIVCMHTVYVFVLYIHVCMYVYILTYMINACRLLSICKVIMNGSLYVHLRGGICLWVWLWGLEVFLV